MNLNRKPDTLHEQPLKPIVDDSPVIEFSYGAVSTVARERRLQQLLATRDRLQHTDPFRVAWWVNNLLYPAGPRVTPEEVAEGLHSAVEGIGTQIQANMPIPINPTNSSNIMGIEYSK